MTGTYLDRAAWGAQSLPRLGHVVPRRQFTGLALHHTVVVLTDYDRDGYLHGDLDDIKRYMRSLQTARPDLGRDVPYSFVVFRGATPDDYVVCEGRGFDRTGTHTQGNNSTRYGVALAGDYTNVAPTAGELAGVRWVGAQLTDPKGARKTIGHRDVHATACPGAHAYAHLGEVQPPFVNAPAPAPAPGPTVLDFGAIDMDQVHTKLVPVGPLDPNGNGWNLVDFGFPVARIIGVACNGPFPKTDGYWPLPRDVAAQMRGDGVVVTATQGWPGSTVNVWVSVA
jgi:hypothetical protein